MCHLTVIARPPPSEKCTDDCLPTRGRAGFDRHGKNWADILKDGDFHWSRTSVDLKDKYRNLRKYK